MCIVGKSCLALHEIACVCKSLKSRYNSTSLTSRYYSYLFLSIDPNNKCFIIVMINSSACWPVSIHTSILILRILLEKQVIIRELTGNFLRHSFNWMEGPLEFSRETLSCSHNFRHDLLTLFSCDHRS